MKGYSSMYIGCQNLARDRNFQKLEWPVSSGA